MTHSAGYEHPTQFTMDDVQKNSWVSDKRKSLFEIYEYYAMNDDRFESMDALAEKHKKISQLKKPDFLKFAAKESRFNYIWQNIKKAA